jgi:competence protein ComEC
MVLVPFLRDKGIGSLDLLIISHADQDHAGGAQSLTEEIETKRILGGEALGELNPSPNYCETSDTWTWDGVVFRIVHPSDAGYWRGNNASCVLYIRVASHRLLLTGDIESPVESLLAGAGHLSQSDIVLIPHHGSRTSSSEQFVSTLRPKLAIVSAGFGNRWGFPKKDVVAAWRNAGAEVLNTATSGAISYRVCRDNGIRRLGLHRLDARKFWH